MVTLVDLVSTLNRLLDRDRHQTGEVIGNLSAKLAGQHRIEIRELRFWQFWLNGHARGRPRRPAGIRA